METPINVFTPAIISMALLELIKIIIRWKKGSQFDFPIKFYAIVLPILNVAVVPFLVWLKVQGYAMPKTIGEYAYAIIVAAVGSFISVFVYNNTIKPAKTYVREQDEIKRGSWRGE
jgi:hypothetical protein